MTALDSRQKQYEEAYDYRLIRRVPIIIRVDGKSFHRVTRKLETPYSADFLGLMGATMKKTIMDIDGAVFGYQQSDEITFILKNNQTLNTDPWFANRIQKLASITSSLVTYNFMELLKSIDNQEFKLIGQTLFDARVFAVPSLDECANNLVFRQADCCRNAVTRIAQHHFAARHGKKQAEKLLFKKSSNKLIKELKDEFNIDVDSYPASFRNGVCTYKVPKMIEKNDLVVKRNTWVLDFDTGLFVDSRSWLMSILENGHDVYKG